MRRVVTAAADAAPEVDRSPAPVWQEDWEVLTRGLGASPPGTTLTFGPSLTGELRTRGERGTAVVRFRGDAPGGLVAAAEERGSIPLPPYIEAARKRGEAEPGAPLDDRERYQTVYARHPGAVAAPTAGLHFTPALLAAIEEAGHEIARLTLHVGPGTFRPVETADPRDHAMDHEAYEISAQAAGQVTRAQAEGRPIVAVGTTVVRALESAARTGGVRAGAATTDLFLLPGAEFRVVTDMITNFHLPRSTLLMLVSAFAGRERVLAAYQAAIDDGYRFYSYGDAMFVRPGELRS